MVKRLNRDPDLLRWMAIPFRYLQFKENAGRYSSSLALLHMRSAAYSRHRSDLESLRTASSVISCAFVCPHATIRPFMLMTEEEAARQLRRPTSSLQLQSRRSRRVQVHHGSVAPLRLYGMYSLRRGVPDQRDGREDRNRQGRPQDGPAGELSAEQQAGIRLRWSQTSPRSLACSADTTVKGTQFNQPLLEFSGSCAGCAETSYARLDHTAVR